MNSFYKTTLACFFLGAALYGCKKDENAGKTPAEKITGNYLVQDTGFVNPFAPNGCPINNVSSFAIIVTKVSNNKVEISNFKYPGIITATVTNTSLVSVDKPWDIYNIVGSLSGKTIRFSYDNDDDCYTHGRATAVKLD